MDCGYRSIPIGLMGNEIVPKLGCGELQGYNDRASREQRGKKAREKSVYVEKRHH